MNKGCYVPENENTCVDEPERGSARCAELDWLTLYEWVGVAGAGTDNCISYTRIQQQFNGPILYIYDV